jgi:hypothetical protein
VVEVEVVVGVEVGVEVVVGVGVVVGVVVIPTNPRAAREGSGDMASGRLRQDRAHGTCGLPRLASTWSDSPGSQEKSVRFGHSPLVTRFVGAEGSD